MFSKMPGFLERGTHYSLKEHLLQFSFTVHTDARRPMVPWVK